MWFTRNKQVKELIDQERVAVYLKRHYSRYIHDVEYTETAVPKIVWICWLQGEENAPALVKQCIRSVRRYASDCEVRILTEQNLGEYVTFPDDVWAKYRSGKIPFTQFSDLLRVALLAEHGGIWMDATVLLTDRLPDYVSSGSLFMFRESWLQRGVTVASSWFLASCAGHPIMVNMRDLLVRYWQRESHLRHYFIVHLFMSVLVRNSEQCKALFERMPYVSNVDVHTMMFRLFEPYTPALWAEITGRSSVHKLSYKWPEEKQSQPGTIFQHVLGL